MIKKVLIIYSGAKVWGGIETYLENLFNSYDRKKLELILVSLGDWELTKKLSGAKHKVVILPSTRIRFKTVSDIVDLVKRENANLLVSQGVVANYYARKAALKSNTPLVTTIHSDIEYDYPNELKKLAYKFSDRIVRKNTTRFITVSKYLKSELIKSGISSDVISVIYNGVVLNRNDKPKKSSSARGRTGSHRSNNKVILGSIGRLHYTKGYHNLIEAMNYLKEFPIKLVIHGDGEERKSLEELIKRNALDEVVSLPGYTKNVQRTLDDMDIFIQPSLMEGFGLAVIDAMNAGKPVIVTPVGSLPEIVADTKTGLITADTTPESLAVMIKTLVKNPELAKELAIAGQKEVAEKFSLDRWARETEKVYLETAK